MAVLPITELTKRYVNLLASQYQQPNAQRQIALFAKQFLADNFIQAVQAAYQLGGMNGAQGVQLDVLGKYIGVTRYQAPAANQPPFFGMLTGTSPGGYPVAFPYTEANYKGTWVPSTNTPTLPAAAGGNNGWWYAIQVAGTSAAPIVATFLQGDIIHSNGTVWAKDVRFNANGFNSSTDAAQNLGAIFITSQNANAPLTALSDAAYVQLLYIQIVRNASNGTLPDVIARLDAYFGTAISVIDNLDMTLTYNVVESAVLLPITVLQNFLPSPAGVSITVNLV